MCDHVCELLGLPAQDSDDLPERRQFGNFWDPLLSALSTSNDLYLAQTTKDRNEKINILRHLPPKKLGMLLKRYMRCYFDA